MGGSESSLKIINHRLNYRYDRLNIDELDKTFEECFPLVQDIEVIRCEFLLRWNEFLRHSGGIILFYPSFEACVQGMLWKLAADTNGKLSMLEISENEPFIISDEALRPEDEQLLRCFQSLCRFYYINQDRVYQLESDLQKYQRDTQLMQSDPETMLSDKYNVAPRDVYACNRKIRANYKKVNMAYAVISWIRNNFEEIRRGLHRYSNWMKIPEQLRRFEDIGVAAHSKNFTKSARIMYKFSKDQKLSSYEDHLDRIQDDMKAEKEARYILDEMPLEKKILLKSQRTDMPMTIIQKKEGGRLPTAGTTLSAMRRETNYSQTHSDQNHREITENEQVSPPEYIVSDRDIKPRNYISGDLDYDKEKADINGRKKEVGVITLPGGERSELSQSQFVESKAKPEWNKMFRSVIPAHELKDKEQNYRGTERGEEIVRGQETEMQMERGRGRPEVLIVNNGKKIIQQSEQINREQEYEVLQREVEQLRRDNLKLSSRLSESGFSDIHKENIPSEMGKKDIILIETSKIGSQYDQSYKPNQKVNNVMKKMVTNAIQREEKQPYPMDIQDFESIQNLPSTESLQQVPQRATQKMPLTTTTQVTQMIPSVVLIPQERPNEEATQKIIQRETQKLPQEETYQQVTQIRPQEETYQQVTQVRPQEEKYQQVTFKVPTESETSIPSSQINPVFVKHHISLQSWNLNLKKTVEASEPQYIKCIEPIIDMDYLVTGMKDGRIIIWKFINFAQIFEHRIMQISKSAIKSMLYLNDGKTLFCGCKDGELVICDINKLTCKTVYQFEVPVVALVNPLNGISICVASGRRIHEVDIINNRLMKSIDAHDLNLTDLVYDQQKDIMCSASKDKTVRIWNFETKECLGVLQGHQDIIKSLCFASTRDHIILCSVSKDSYITFWNLSDKNRTKSLKCTTPAKKVFYLWDKKTVSTVHKSGVFALWDIEKDNEKDFFESKTPYTAGCYFDDGRNMIYSTEAGTLEFWNAK